MESGPLAGVSYEDLFARWERGGWSATELDFGADRGDWERLSEIQRLSMRWHFAMFFKGEDSVAEHLSPFIAAAPREEQRYFLATQQADEARHAVFFGRFFEQVLGASGSLAERLAACEPELNWGHRRSFERLERMADELRRDRSAPKLAQAVTLYHLVLEGQLGEPGLHFIEGFTTRMDVLPGFRTGIANVARDEQRHIAFGVKLLAELFAVSEECRAAAAEILAEMLRYSVSVYVPPGRDRRYSEALGFTIEEVYTYTFEAFERRLQAIGLPAADLPPGAYPFDTTKPVSDRAAHAIAMLEAGISGDPATRPSTSPEAQRLFFDVIERAIDIAALNGRPLTLQWRFSDAAPWHVLVEHGRASAVPGEAPAPDVVLRSTWADWVHAAAGTDGLIGPIVRRRIKVGGRPRQLLRARAAMPA
jgi:ribonucleotide reductase beta subunit family protein with ferritin-like domain